MKPKKHSPIRFIRVTASSLLFCSFAHAADYTWDFDTNTAGNQDGSGNWNTTNSNWTTGGVNAPWLNPTTPGDKAIIGSGSGAAGTITLDQDITASNLTLNAAGSGNYTFDGGKLNLTSPTANDVILTVNSSATFNNEVNAGNGNNNRILFATAGQSLTFTGGGSILSMGTTTGISGSTAAIAKASTINVTSGTYGGTFGLWNIGDAAAGTGGMVFTGASTVSNVQILQIGNQNGGGFLTVTGGATVSTIGQISIGRSGGNVGRVVVDGATLKNAGSISNDAAMQIGREGGVGTFDLRNGTVSIIGPGITNNNGGIVVLNSQSGNVNSSGTLNISGGTMTVKDLRLNGTNQHVQANASAGTAILNLSGGSLYIGGTVRDNNTVGADASTNFDIQGGLTNRANPTGTATYQVNLSGGVLGANADWTSTVDMSLVSGNTTIKTADEANVGHAITFSGALSGAGAMTKTGDSTLTLNSTVANTFTGGTTITAGTLVAATAGAMGSGSVTLAAGVFTSQDANAIGDTAAVLFASGTTINLDYATSDTIGSLTNTTTGTSAAVGTYTATELNAIFEGNVFQGTGSLTITAVPEASSTALLALGLTSLGFIRRRKTA